MTLSHEYPKWLHAPGKVSVIVNDADAETAQLAAWEAVAPPVQVPAPTAPAVVETPPAPVIEAIAPATVAPASNLGDWDGDGHPGGSVASDKPANALTTPAQPKRGGGWPKGKSRTGNRR